MKCPVCGIELTMSEKKGIEIDSCPQCRGVWLDRGELDKIIERSISMPHREYRETDEHPGRDTYKEHQGHKVRSFLEDIFD